MESLDSEDETCKLGAGCWDSWAVGVEKVVPSLGRGTIAPSLGLVSAGGACCGAAVPLFMVVGGAGALMRFPRFT